MNVNVSIKSKKKNVTNFLNKGVLPNNFINYTLGNESEHSCIFCNKLPSATSDADNDYNIIVPFKQLDKKKKYDYQSPIQVTCCEGCEMLISQLEERNHPRSDKQVLASHNAVQLQYYKSAYNEMPFDSGEFDKLTLYIEQSHIDILDYILYSSIELQTVKESGILRNDDIEIVTTYDSLMQKHGFYKSVNAHYNQFVIFAMLTQQKAI
jgi:hypothetical protein